MNWLVSSWMFFCQNHGFQSMVIHDDWMIWVPPMTCRKRPYGKIKWLFFAKNRGDI